MSIILDALRKSDNERRRQERPGISQLPPALPRATVPAWVFTTLGALATLVVVLSVAFWRLTSGPVEQASTASPTGAPVVTERTRTPVGHTDDQAVEERALTVPAEPLPTGEIRPLAREIPQATAPAARSVESSPPTPQPPASATRTTPQAQTDRSTSASDLPSLDELMAMGESGVPDLHMDLHVYATDPAQRFVFINGRRMRHGDELAGGVRVIEILADGVILQYDGRRFVLPRD